MCGFSAARVLGLDVALPKRPEVIVPPLVGVVARAQATVRRVMLTPEEVTMPRGLPVTTPCRTCFDLAGRLSRVEAVVVVDMALHAGLVTSESWSSCVAAHTGRKGVAGARRTLPHVEPKAESPMESRLRMLLVGAGLPCPEAQVPLYDSGGDFVGRPDLYYASARLGLEYDGENHRDRLIADDRRQNRLQQIGVVLLRFTHSDLTERPEVVIAQVRNALAKSPTP
ncbi:MAG: endonuclease domain-containing protein [Candidatus Dormibacteraceae bacterium]